MLRSTPRISEAARLAALRNLNILDTEPERRFDNIVEFAVREFEVPIAVISLVDSDRQWFKSKFGMDICGSDRKSSICTHAIEAPDIFTVPDLSADARFFDNPFVVQPPCVRSYAGAVLRLSGGEAVGMLCLLDTRPRKFSWIDLVMLRMLRDMVIGELTGVVPA